MRRIVVTIAMLCSLTGTSAAQPPPPAPTFEVVSIKPASPPIGPFLPGSRLVCPVTGCGGPGTSSPERITFTYSSLKNLIQVAYDVRSYQVEGPAWLESARFDVVANVPPGTTRDQAHLMLQKLLADRFRLRLHRSTRNVAIYALVVASSGPKLKVSVDDPNVPRGRGTIWSPGSAQKRFEFDRFTMAKFAQALEPDVDRPVIDRTALVGTYDIRLVFAPRSSSGFGSTNPQDTPELFTALTEQLGLKLEPGRGPVEVLVIDSVERPAPD